VSKELGRVYRDGEDIVKQGEVGDCMYIIQQGTADVIRTEDGESTVVDTMQSGELFGEMAIVENTVRSSTVKARGTVRAITIDRKTFLRRIQEDPSLAISVLEVLCHRVRNLDDTIAKLKHDLDSSSGGGT
jgi:CRP-like cAMP-binding protein